MICGHREVFREQHGCVGYGIAVGVEVPLRGGERPVSGDFAEVVDGCPCIGHPGQSSVPVPEVVAPQVLVTELGYDFIPRCRVRQHGSGDPAAWTGEQSCVGDAVRRGNPLQCEFMNFRDQVRRGYACPLVPLSTRPPGEGVVWRRTVHTQLVVLRSFTRQPETSPMQAAVHAAKMTTSPHTA
jgi:hypothetical protein